ncbi:MAG: alpha/beta hydrolase [Actinobacteria bacterium]|nr:alpha/beta hydrolase [Actinomycetota bacterium]
MPLDPQVKVLLDQMAAVGGAPLEQMSPTEARTMFGAMAAMAGAPEEVASVEDRRIAGADGHEIPVRIYTPDAGTAPRPVVVYFHGGGFVIGDIDSHDPTCRQLANLTGCVVVSVDYRLAPEHRAPAAAEDSFAATKWVADNAASIGVDPARVAVAGDSAGGNLATVTALLARDRGGPAITFQLLIYPVTDLTMSQPSIEQNGEGYMLTGAGLRWFYDHYLGAAGDAKDPILSPLFAPDLSGLPPALVVTAEFDPLRDEGEAYADRLREAGVAVTVKRYDGLIHGFFAMGMVLDATRAAVPEIAAALKANLEA